MGYVDNSELLSGFLSAEDDGDTFWYTELLDRSHTKGSNKFRTLKTFFYSSRAGFWSKWPVIRELCEQTGTRAYTRLSPRSYSKVGKLLTTSAVAASLDGHFKGMKSLYASACGKVVPNVKYWLYDVDVKAFPAGRLETWLKDQNLLVEVVPSRQGYHLIVKPFDVSRLKLQLPISITLHKDNPTNLYIPENAK